MKRILVTLLCLGILGTVTGCPVGSREPYQRQESTQGQGFWQWQQDLSRAYRGTAE